MSFYTGRSGALFLTTVGTGDVIPAATEQVLKLRDWSLETSLELLETTTLDTAVKSYTPGIVSSTGSATVLYYRKETIDVGVQFNEFLGKIMKTSSAGVEDSDGVGMVLRVAAVTNTNGVDIKDDIAFNAFITSASLQVSTGELSSVAINFTVNGPFRELLDA